MFKEKTVNVNRKENKKPMNKKTDKRKYTYIPKNKDEDIVAKPYEDVFKYEMPNEMAKLYLKERKGSDVKMDANDFLCKVVNDNFGLKGRCVKVIRR
jgi:hypothetical protein